MDRRAALVGLLGAGGWFFLRSSIELGSTSIEERAGRGSLSPVGTKTLGTGRIKSVTIKPAPLGGGGFITGIDQSADGRRFVCRTDVCNAYVRNVDDPAWRPLFSPSSLSESDRALLAKSNGNADGQGVASVRIAPSNKDIIYASYYGWIWRSDDGGIHFRRTGLAQKKMLSNAGVQRCFNRSLDISPSDPDCVVAATWGDGVWYSANGGLKWTEIDVPTPVIMPDNQAGLSLVLFGLNPNTLYIFVGGVGLFSSSNGIDGGFAPVPGGPQRCSSMTKGPDGGLYLCEYLGNDAGVLWRFDVARGWSSSRLEHELFTLAVHPKDPKRIFGTNQNGYDLMSSDGGLTTVTKQIDFKKEGSEVNWIADLKTLAMSEVIWDRIDDRFIWYATGVGVHKVDPVAGTLIDWSAGIEELIAFSGISVPSGSTLLTAWDKPIWQLKSEVRYVNSPSYMFQEGQDRSVDPVTNGTFLDYAGDDPHCIVGVLNEGSSFGRNYGPGLSRDGGNTWVRFSGTPPRGWGYGGCIAASTSKNFILLPSNNAAGAFTVDGGESWETIQLDGVHETSHFANAYYVSRKNITADKTRSGVFALVYTVISNPASPESANLGGIWLTRDGGRTWQLKRAGVVGDRPVGAAVPLNQDPRQFWRCQIEFVPGAPNELVYTGYADYGDDRLWWSKDDGESWSELHSAIRAVVSFGFGKPAPDQTRPSVYFYGKVDDMVGTFASFDWFATKPIMVARNASPQLANIAWVLGDANRFGRIWLGTGGGGWLIADLELSLA